MDQSTDDITILRWFAPVNKTGVGINELIIQAGMNDACF